MSRGTISDVSSEARTATEIKILRQRSFSANREVQNALQICLEDVVYAMDVYCTMYNIVDDIKYTEKDGKRIADTSEMGKYDVSFEWDDSILIDQESELATRLTLYEKNLESRVALRMWYFGETEAQAQDALNKIAEEKREAIESNMAMSSALGQQVRNNNGQTEGDLEGQNPEQLEDTQEIKPQQESDNT